LNILGVSIPFLAATLIVLFFGMGWHEYGHAVVAHWWGDPTPAQTRRLTPNPLAHINWGGFIFYVILVVSAANQLTPVIGVILLLIIVMGGRYLNLFALGSVPINPRLMRDPRWGGFWSSFAGPLANLLQAFVAAIILRVVSNPIQAYTFFASPSMVQTPGDFVLLLLATAVFLNIVLFVFNLLPFYPIDGWRMMLSLLPGYFLRREQVPTTIRKNVRPLSEFLQHPAFKWQDWQEITYVIFIGLLIIGFMIPQIDILGAIINPAIYQLTFLMFGF
jgi:Zn-dependent protease